MRPWRLEMLNVGPLCDELDVAVHPVHPSRQSPTNVVCVKIEVFA